MIDSFVVGQKLVVDNKYDFYDGYNLKNRALTVSEYDGYSDATLADEEGKVIYVGKVDVLWFNYFGNNINHEVLNLINLHQVKSFQATLDDGRVIHMSCLN